MQLMVAAADGDALSEAGSSIGTSRREKGVKGGKGTGKGGALGATRKGKDKESKSKERPPAQMVSGVRSTSPGAASNHSTSSTGGGSGSQVQSRGDQLQTAPSVTPPRVSPQGIAKRNSPVSSNWLT